MFVKQRYLDEWSVINTERTLHNYKYHLLGNSSGHADQMRDSRDNALLFERSGIYLILVSGFHCTTLKSLILKWTYNISKYLTWTLWLPFRLGGTEGTMSLVTGGQETSLLYSSGLVHRILPLYLRTFCPMDMSRYIIFQSHFTSRWQ